MMVYLFIFKSFKLAKGHEGCHHFDYDIAINDDMNDFSFFS